MQESSQTKKLSIFLYLTIFSPQITKESIKK